eukprot:scaffold12089_cov86-Cylindrotheca_fusiformis.AAC.1
MFLNLPIIADLQALQDKRQEIVQKNLARANQRRIRHDYQPGQRDMVDRVVAVTIHVMEVTTTTITTTTMTTTMLAIADVIVVAIGMINTKTTTTETIGRAVTIGTNRTTTRTIMSTGPDIVLPLSASTATMVSMLTKHLRRRMVQLL